MTSATNLTPFPSDTPASQIFFAWLSAINSGDIEQIRAFTNQHENNEDVVQRRLRMHQMTGGLTLLRIEKNEAMTVVALVENKNSEVVDKVELTLQSLDPPKLEKIIVLSASRPADLQLARLTQSEAIASLANKLEDMVKQDSFSGTILIARHGKVLFQHAYGHADREAQRPVTLNTQFRIGSINKTFTAIAVLQLIEAGKISFDDTVGRFLPDYPNETIKSKVTIRHLLTHTGGTGDIFTEEYWRRPHEIKEHQDYIKLFGVRETLFEPGSKFEYSNYGYILLGRLLEVISGMSYYDYVEQAVFNPAGMTATASLPESENVPERAVGYMWQEGKRISNADVLSYRGTSAGGGYSTAGDILKFSEALAKAKLMSQPMLMDATRRQTEFYGFGFIVSGEGKLQRYGHSGGFPGISADFRIYPESGYVLICLSNFGPVEAEAPLVFFENRMPLD